MDVSLPSGDGERRHVSDDEEEACADEGGEDEGSEGSSVDEDYDSDEQRQRDAQTDVELENVLVIHERILFGMMHEAITNLRCAVEEREALVKIATLLKSWMEGAVTAETLKTEDAMDWQSKVKGMVARIRESLLSQETGTQMPHGDEESRHRQTSEGLSGMANRLEEVEDNLLAARRRIAGRTRGG